MKLLFENFQAPGDVLMLTAAVRDLHRAAPGRFQCSVRTSAPALWENNPYVTPRSQMARPDRVIRCQYPLIHSSNQRPYHFIHGFAQFLEDELGVRIRLTDFRGDIHLSTRERIERPKQLRFDGEFWIVVSGGKYDFTTKWWNPKSYQAVVDHFAGTIRFVQCGESGHFHPRLRGATNLVGRTKLRDFVHLMHWSGGVLCPVTLAMHLCAAVPSRPGTPPRRPCVVVAGGREPAHWEAYPWHQFLHTVGALDCCALGGCWKSRSQRIGDGNDQDLCTRPVRVNSRLRIAGCMDMITAGDVIRAIELFRAGAALGQPRES
jgi:ADP-heptose:LPS heptosyltransferase